MASYRIQVWSTSTSDFSPDVLVAEFENPKNVGYASYINDIGEAFFTISQYDLKVNVRAHEGKGHVVIIRQADGAEDVVWRGILAEHDANARDVIFYAYGYEHLLHSLLTRWNQKWRNKEIAGASGRPINDLWTRATGITDSPVQWIATGTLQSPYNTNAKTTNVTLNRYRTNLKKILTAMKELVAIATSDTTNMCFLEIDYPTDPTDLSATFNFWKDNSEDNTKIRLEWGSNVMDYNDRFTPVLFRNKTFGVGTGPRNQLYRYNFTVRNGTYGRNTLGMRMQNMYLSWVRDRKELKRIVKRRTRLALRTDTNFWVRCYPDSIPPWRATAATHELGDRIYTKVDHGITQIDKWLHFIGEQVVFVNGREYVQPMLEDKAGDEATYRPPTWLCDNGHDMTPSDSSKTTSETIPGDTRLVVAIVGCVGSKTIGTSQAPTLNGVAGTFLGWKGEGLIVQEKSIAAWYWLSPNVSAGETVDLVVYNPFARYLTYGLVEASADDYDPEAEATSTFSSAGGTPSTTIDTSTVSAFSIMAALTTNGPATGMVSGSTHLVSLSGRSNGTSGTQILNVGYETAATSGSRTVGFNGSYHHTGIASAFSNEQS